MLRLSTSRPTLALYFPGFLVSPKINILQAPLSTLFVFHSSAKVLGKFVSANQCADITI